MQKMKSIDMILDEFKELTQYIPEREQEYCFDIFVNAYNEHKKMFGSFRELPNDEYFLMMGVRQNYQLRKVKEYIDKKKYDN